MGPSLVWSTAYVFLLLEIAITVILVIPVPIKIRNLIARQIFKLKMGERLSKPILFIGIALAFGFIDSYMKLQNLLDKMDEQHTLEVEHGHMGGGPGTMLSDGYQRIQIKEKKYKAERNLYLTGFAFTLLFVIGRITQLMQEHVELEQKTVLQENKLNASGVTITVENNNNKKPAEKKN